MIGFYDVITLASTKLHAHKIRTTIAIIISSILFAVLILAFILATGITSSIKDFNAQGLNNKYLVFVNPIPALPSGYSTSDDFINYLQTHFQDYVDKKTAEAKRLGINYDPKTEPSPVSVQVIPGQGTVTRPNFGSPEVFTLMRQYAAEHPTADLSDLQKLADKYDSTDISAYTQIDLSGMLLMPGGKEILAPTDDQQKQLAFPSQNSNVVSVSQTLTQPFLLPSQNIDPNDVPIVVSYRTIEQILGLKSLSSDASYQQKLDRIQTLYKKAKGLTVSVCYRNSASSNQIQTAIQQASDKVSAGKDYKAPELIYGLPDLSSCGQVPVASDTRTDAEKNHQLAEDEFSAEFSGSAAVDPVQSLVTFQVVGLSPNTNSDYGLSLGDLVQGLTGSSLGADIVIPSNLLDSMADNSSKQIIKQIISSSDQLVGGASYKAWIVSFKTSEDARKFIEDNNCNQTMESNTCTNGNHQFTMGSWANNSIAVSDLTRKITFVLEISTLAVTILAIIILTIMVGRTVSDSRKETAVFRALGASRADIVSVYIIYTIYIVIIIAIVSLIVGLVGAFVIQSIYSEQATIIAKLLFDAVNTNIMFNFFDVNYPLLGLIILVILVAGLLSIIIPLARNVPRSPIRDMREE